MQRREEVNINHSHRHDEQDDVEIGELMLSFSRVKSAGSAGNYYTDKDNYYVIGSMDERWREKVRQEDKGLHGVRKTTLMAKTRPGRDGEYNPVTT